MKNSFIYESTAGPVELDGAKIAFLPSSRTLLVADLHFEKGSYLQMVGNASLPAYDTVETLDRLQKIIEIYDPDHVVALGDSFHDSEADKRIAQTDIDSLNTLIKNLARFTWILGNHDPDIPRLLNGAQEDHLEIDGFLLTHLPVEPDLGQTNICGHLHPKARISMRRRRMSYPCHACSDGRIILPSFGAYTGGLYVDHDAIDSVLGGKRVYALTTRNGIYAVRA